MCCGRCGQILRGSEAPIIHNYNVSGKCWVKSPCVKWRQNSNVPLEVSSNEDER